MPTSSEIFFGLVLPAIVAIAGWGVAWWLGRGRWAEGQWVGGFIVAAGFLLGYCTFAGRPSIRPTDFYQWLLYIGGGVALLGMADALAKPPLWVRGPLVLIVAELAIWLLVCQLFGYTLRWITMPAIMIFIWWLAMEVLAKRAPGVTVPAVFGITAIGVSLFLTSNGNDKLGKVAASLAGIAAGAVLIAIVIRKISFERGAVMVFVFLIGGWFAAGYISAENTPFSMMDGWTRDGQLTQDSLSLLLAIAPLLALTGDLPGVRKLPNWQRLVIRLAAVAIPVAIMGFFAVRNIGKMVQDG